MLHLAYRQMPSHHTFRLVFADVLEEEAFEQHMRAYGARQRGAPKEAGLLVIDWKKEHGTMPPWESQSEAIQAVYDLDQEQVMAQVAI